MAYEFVDPPHGLSYAAPAVDFGILGNLGNTYRQAQDQARQAAVADAFKDQPLPLDPATGLPDYGKIMQVLASKGGVDAITRLAPAATEQALLGQAQKPSPFFSPAAPPAGGQTAAPPVSPPGPSAAPQSLPAPPAAASTGYVPMQNASGSVVDIVSSRLPQDSQTTGAVIANIARAAGVDPNAALTPEQSARVTRLADAYAARTGGARTASAAPASAPPQSPNAQVASRFPTDLPPAIPRSAVAAGAAAPSTPVQAGPAAATAPASAPVAQAGPPADAGGQRLVPAVPLPPGFKQGQEQQAIIALRAEAARRATNPYDKQAPALIDWANRIENSLQPVKVGQYDTIVSPTGQTIYQGPMAKSLSSGTGTLSGTALEGAAQRYYQTGQFPSGMTRDTPTNRVDRANIQNLAYDLAAQDGLGPADLPRKWQEYRAEGVGLSAGARTAAVREKNLDLILRVTDAAIPAALEQSAKVWRTGIVPVNKIIQAGQVMTSDAELRSFGMANLQLAEGWARAMNPTGVMRESDRDKALDFLSTADSPETYRRLVMQLKTQITRERDSIRSGGPMREGDSAPAPGVSASSAGGGNVVRWERGPDGKLRPAQ